MRSILLFCAVMSVTSAWGQAPAKALSPFEQELVNNQNQFMQALQTKNVALVNQTVASDFRGIATNGDMFDRDEVLNTAHEGLPKDFRIYDIQIVRLDDGCAVVTYNEIVPGSHPRYRHMSDTWTKDGGGWKLRFEQTTVNMWAALDLD